MNPLPERGTPAGDAFLAIQKLARSTGSDVQELLTLYALEGVLARVAQSHWSEEFVLKGGVLLAAFDLRRPTKDIDLQATGLPNDVEAVLDRVRTIAGLDLEDGLIFQPGSVAAQPIREEDECLPVPLRGQPPRVWVAQPDSGWATLHLRGQPPSLLSPVSWGEPVRSTGNPT